MEIWFSSDTHFGHNQEFLYKPRGFSSVKEMNETIISNWNSVVKPEDITYLLGDIMLGDNEMGLDCVRQLNGQIFLIWGNHCTDNRKNLLFNDERIRHKVCGGFYAHCFKYKKTTFYLSHYPTLTAYFAQNVINLHGHTHQRTNFLNPTNPFMYHVGVDSHNCTPVHIEEIITDIKQRWNEIPPSAAPLDLYPYDSVFTGGTYV